jgi:anti-sigma B factor antagonist
MNRRYPVDHHARFRLMAATNLKHISIKEKDGVATVDFVDSQLMFATDVVDEIGEELHSLISDHGFSKMIVDFRNVQYISSMVLAKLANLERHIAIAHGKLKLCGLGPVLMDTFRIGHFERFFDIYDDAEAAQKSPW